MLNDKLKNLEQDAKQEYSGNFVSLGILLCSVRYDFNDNVIAYSLLTGELESGNAQ